jgi:hypothetical protein
MDGPLPSDLGVAEGRYGDLGPALYGALLLLRGGGGRDVLQLLTHLIDPVS